MSCGPDEEKVNNICCKRCPKGTHAEKQCDKSQERQCKSCPHGYYTEENHLLTSCLPCRSCDSANHLKELKPCKADIDRVCECINGFFCSKHENTHGCLECTQVKTCPPGHQASVRPNRTHDTVCQPCPPGTFNNKTDYISLCQNHTSCSTLGRYLESVGTAKSDSVCGDFMSRCHWLLPAGLWAGLILTFLIMITMALCWRSKHRKKAVSTSVISENFIAPALPPDVIKHPNSPEIEMLAYNSKLCAEEDDGGLECDGISVDMFPGNGGAFTIPDTCTSFNDPYRSEPQEDDWPGL